ncbi:MAG: hypothetical protein U0821_00110 [Chloroflexota bacterium]
MEIAVVFRAPVANIDERRPSRCAHCGSYGFNIHQHATKSLKGPGSASAQVVRFICKRCRRTVRLYPDGVDAARQSTLLRRLSAMLYWLGLPYDGVREVLMELGCPLSKATVWANVRALGLINDRFRLRADPGTLKVYARPNGASVVYALRGCPARIKLAVMPPDGLTLWFDTPQPDGSARLHERVCDIARRLELEVRHPREQAVS